MDSFYITLPSNVSNKLHAQNNSANFKTTLKTPLSLEGKWEVALSEIQFPNKWLNITSSNNLFYVNSVKNTYRRSLGLRFLPPDKRAAFDPKLIVKIDMTKAKFPGQKFITRENYWHSLLINLAISAERGESPYVPGGITIETIHTTTDETVATINLGEYSMKFENASDNIKFFENISFMEQLLGISRDNYYVAWNGTLINDKASHLRLLFTGKTKLKDMYSIPINLFVDHSVWIFKSVNEGLYWKQDNIAIVDTVLDLDIPIKIPLGNYATPEALIEVLNQEMAVYVPNDCIRFSLLDTKVVQIHSINRQFYSVKFPIEQDAMGSLLGFDTLGFNLPSNFDEANYCDSENLIDINRGVYNLFVYCDLVAQQIVGDSYANLLRVVHAGGGDTLVQTYSQEAYYKELAVNYITTIHIVIKSDSDQEIEFQGGKTLIVLHFKRKH